MARPGHRRGTPENSDDGVVMVNCRFFRKVFQMRGLGIVGIVIGVLLLIVAISMDVTVSSGSGMGRVNNLGLIAERQNLTTIGGILLLAGLVMLIFGARQKAANSALSPDERPCPFCAEPIKRAAIKCKHCSTDVEPAPAAKLTAGWVSKVSCRDDSEKEKATGLLEGAGFEVVPMKGSDVGAGLFATKSEAEEATRLINGSLKLYASTIYRDDTSGRFPPL